MRTFAESGVRHIVGSTGRLSKKSINPDSASLWERIQEVIHRQSPENARRFEREYIYERGSTGQGYLLRKDIRLALHRKFRALAEENGMTYATCQELGTDESDSPGLSHCQRFILPFARKGTDGLFHPIDECTANCHVTCRDVSTPPCGQPQLTMSRPFKVSHLKARQSTINTVML
jgi:hypothetical protein